MSGSKVYQFDRINNAASSGIIFYIDDRTKTKVGGVDYGANCVVRFSIRYNLSFMLT